MQSRHDHYPRFDMERRARLRAATSGREEHWGDADAGPGGLGAAIDAALGMGADDAIAALMPWLADIGWLRARLESALDLLAADLFARPPLRPVGGGEGAGGLILAERGAIRLSLQLHRAGAPESAAALFIPGRLALRILRSGGASVRDHHVTITPSEEGGGFTAACAARCRTGPRRALVDDELWVLDTTCTAFTLSDAIGDALLLELSVQPPSPLPIRSYDIASGRLLHVSASRRDSSFRQMALSLLRTFSRVDAAPLFDAATNTDDFAARWSAMREYIALAPATAHPRLAYMATDDLHPEVRRAAATALALYDSFSGRGRGETASCPA